MKAARVILASANPGKLRELQALLAPLGFELTPQELLGIESAAETGATFLANALIKARHAAAGERRCPQSPMISGHRGRRRSCPKGARGSALRARVQQAEQAPQNLARHESLEKLLGSNCASAGP